MIASTAHAATRYDAGMLGGTHTQQAIAPPGVRGRVLVVVAIGTFVVSLDTTVNVALPAMTAALDAPIAELQWIIIAYVLTTTSLVLGFGRLADMLGRRRLWIGGLVALAGALFGCGLAPSLGWLVVARALQAVGAAMALASGAALVTAVFPGGERGKALGLLALGGGGGQAAGPLLGGALVSAFGWQAVFLGRAPLALTAAVLSLLVLPRETALRRRERFDALGAGLLAGAMVAFLLALNRGPLWGWSAARTLGLAAAAIMLLGAFVIRERTFAAPVIDLALLRDRRFAVANLSSYLSSLAMFGVWLLLPYYLVMGRGFSAVESGWFLACVPVALSLTAPFSGRLSDRIGVRWPAAAGLLLEAVALLAIARLGAATPLPLVTASLLALGIGLGIFQAPNQSAVMGSVPPSALGVASGMVSMMRTLGVVSGVAVLGAVYAAALPHAPTGASPPFDVSAFQAAFTVAAAVALVAAFVTAARGRR
jgi:EmrB/QacA subfamily drug resistance transporter